MEKVIKIGKQEVRLNNNTSWTMEYRDQFGKDIVPTIMPMIMSLFEGFTTAISETGKTDPNLLEIASSVSGRSTDILLPLYQLEFVDIVNITWAMAKAADEGIAPPKQWIKQFEEFPLDVVLPAVYDLVVKGFVSSKNLRRLKKTAASLKNLQPSTSMTSSSQGSNEG